MPLQKQTIPIVFGALDTKSNPKNAPMGKLDRVINQFRQKTGELRRATGRAVLGTGAAFSGSYSWRNISQLAAYKGSLLSLSNNTAAPSEPPIFSYSDAASKVVGVTAGAITEDALKSFQQGEIVSDRAAVASEDIQAKRPDMAVDPTTGIAIVAWEYRDAAENNYIVEAIYDTKSKKVLGTTTHTAFANPRCEAVGGYLFLVMYRPATPAVAVRRWTANTLSSGASYGELYSVAVDRMDTAIINSKLTIASYTGGNVTMAEVVPSTLATTTNAFAADANLSIALVKDLAAQYGTTAKRYLATVGTTDGLHVRQISAALAVDNNRTVDAAVNVNAFCRNVIGYTYSTNADEWIVLYELGFAATATAPYNDRINIGMRQSGATATAAWNRSVGIRSKAFKQGSAYYFVAAYGYSIGNTMQPSYFLMQAPTVVTAWAGGGGDAGLAAVLDSDRKAPLCKTLMWQGVGSGAVASNVEFDHDNTTLADTNNSSCIPCNVTVAPDGKWMCSVPRITFQIATGGNSTTTIRIGVDAIGYQFDTLYSQTAYTSTIRTGRPAEAADLLLVPAGNLLAFDGRQYSELNFPVYPERPAIANSGTAGALVAGQTYRYAIVYRYIDEQGRIHRSAPSPAQVTATTVGAVTSLDLTIPTCRIHGRQTMVVGAKADIKIEIYRTANGGAAPYYLVDYKENDDTADTIAFNDGAADTSITSNERLYTDGGVLTNYAPPQLRAVVEFRGHLIGISADYPDQLWVSKVVGGGVGPAFNPAQLISVPDEYGAFTALAVMDDKLICFKRSAIYVIAADGPNDLGQGMYPFPQRFAVGDGTIHPRSVVVEPGGVWFLGTRGLKRIGRGLDIKFLGAELDDYSLDIAGGRIIHSAVHKDQKHQVWFYSRATGETSSPAFVWDYAFNQWYVRTDTSPISACLYGTSVNGFVIAQAATTGIVGIDDETSYTDADSLAAGLTSSGEYQQSCRTTWISTAGIEGFGRLYQINLVTTRKLVGVAPAVLIEYDDNAGAAPTGRIQCVAKASIVNGETVTIQALSGATGTPYSGVFTFDTTGGGVPAGTVQVNISTDVTAAQVAARLATAITTFFLGDFTVSAPASIITLTAAWSLTYLYSVSNLTITETVANAGFTVTGLSGGFSYETVGLTSLVGLDGSGRYFVCPKRQDCTSFRVTISDDSTANYDTFNLDGMSLLVGVKKNLARLPLAQRLA